MSWMLWLFLFLTFPLQAKQQMLYISPFFWCCRSIVALLVAVPEVTGASLTSELYSPHLDVHQRMLIMETLATAAQQMADPRLRLGAGRGRTGSQSDRLGRSDASSSGRGADEGTTYRKLSHVNRKPSACNFSECSSCFLLCGSCMCHLHDALTVWGYIHVGVWLAETCKILLLLGL